MVLEILNLCLTFFDSLSLANLSDFLISRYPDLSFNNNCVDWLEIPPLKFSVR